MRVKKIEWSPYGGYHTITCEICSEMAKRGYNREEDYWNDFFAGTLKPIKFKLVKVPKKK